MIHKGLFCLSLEEHVGIAEIFIKTDSLYVTLSSRYTYFDVYL